VASLTLLHHPHKASSCVTSVCVCVCVCVCVFVGEEVKHNGYLCFLWGIKY
jgi:hypothetical protein